MVRVGSRFLFDPNFDAERSADVMYQLTAVAFYVDSVRGIL